MFDPLAQLHRGVDHQRVEQQDQQRQLPVHPDQDRRGAGQGEHGHQKAAEGLADKFIEGIEVGNQVRGHRAAAEALIFAKGNPLEPFDQANADAVDDVFRQAGKQPRLQYVEHQRTAAQKQGQHQHQADIAGGGFPVRRQEVVHDLERGVTVIEQHFVDQQRQQQRDRHAT